MSEKYFRYFGFIFGYFTLFGDIHSYGIRSLCVLHSFVSWFDILMKSIFYLRRIGIWFLFFRKARMLINLQMLLWYYMNQKYTKKVWRVPMETRLEDFNQKNPTNRVIFSSMENILKLDFLENRFENLEQISFTGKFSHVRRTQLIPAVEAALTELIINTKAKIIS